MTKAQVSKAVMMLFAAYPQGERIPDATIQIYENSLIDLEYDDLRASVASLVRSSRYIPTIAELRAAVPPPPVRYWKAPPPRVPPTLPPPHVTAQVRALARQQLPRVIQDPEDALKVILAPIAKGGQ